MRDSIVSEPELAASAVARCPYCRAVVTGDALELWDGRRYHQSCIEMVSPELLAFARGGGELVETLERSDLKLIHGLVNVYRTLWISVGVMACFVALRAQGPGMWATIAFVFLFFGVGGMLIGFLQLLGHLWRIRRPLPRTVRIADGMVTVTSRNYETQVPLEACRWYYGRTSVDEVNLFTRFRRGVVITLPDRDISCGHDAEITNLWWSFLTLSQTWYSPPIRWGTLTVALLLGSILGFEIGAGIGLLVAWIDGNPMWIDMLGFLGIIDGGAFVLIYAACISEGYQAAYERVHPAVIWLTFGTLGFGVSFGDGALQVALVALGNAVVGGIAAAVCRAKVRARERERAAAMELLR